MKKRNIVSTLAVTVIVSTAAWTMQPAQAQSKTVRFFCGKDRTGKLATMVQPANQSKPGAPIVRWVSGFFSGRGYTPEMRCGQVSQRFQTAFNANPNFKFTAARLNGNPVICASDRKGGACQTLLYTLKPGVQDPILTMMRLEKVRVGASGPLNESTASTPAPEPQEFGIQALIDQAFNSPSDMPANSKPAPQSFNTSEPIAPKALW
jgi:Circadian oscillating protein COP23